MAADGLAEELGKDGYRVARAMFLEEEPKIADWRQVAAPEGPVMVLPHFLAGGLHGSEDVPGLLGIPHGRRFRLMVAEELDRLDKIVAETKQAERRSRNPSQWELRN